MAKKTRAQRRFHKDKKKKEVEKKAKEDRAKKAADARAAKKKAEEEAENVSDSESSSTSVYSLPGGLLKSRGFKYEPTISEWAREWETPDGRQWLLMGSLRLYQKRKDEPLATGDIVTDESGWDVED